MSGNNKTLIDIAKTHHSLVRSLKRALLVSQLSFLEAGKYLYRIWSQKTYLAEDSENKVSFSDFLQRPDLAFPGHAKNARLRIAQRLIRIYKFYVLDKKLPEKRLAPIGYTKLDLIIPAIKKEKEPIEDWIEKAELLTVEDLIEQIRQKDKNLEELLNCPHTEIKVVTTYHCQCGVVFKRDPRLNNHEPSSNN